jgi:hypothetical protein
MRLQHHVSDPDRSSASVAEHWSPEPSQFGALTGATVSVLVWRWKTSSLQLSAQHAMCSPYPSTHWQWISLVDRCQGERPYGTAGRGIGSQNEALE